ncbi:MAG: response regulator [Desulfuromonadales bacterium]|nr:response regulator [Desulfuromonadales bacterium]
MATTPNTASVLSILFVEDDEVTLKIQVVILTSKFPGIIIHTATNGKLGLELFKIHTPDIVITDINMSEMCGVQMANNIRAFKPDTKFIAITGKDTDEILFEFDCIIVKPLVFNDLFAAIEKCIDGIA